MGPCGVVGDDYWFTEDVSRKLQWIGGEKFDNQKAYNNKKNCYVKIKVKLWLLMKSFGGPGPLSKMTLPIVTYDKHYNKMCTCT
jgi:hypothetical protein